MADTYVGQTDHTGGTLTIDDLFADADIFKVFSKEIIYQAMPIMRFKQFAKVRTELSGRPGTSINFHKLDNLGFGGDVLTEENEISISQALTTSSIVITVGEHGKALGVTEFLLKHSPMDVLGEAAKLLGRHYAQTMDDLCRNTIVPATGQGLSVTKYADGLASRSAIGANNTFDTDLIKDGVEYLATENVPMIAGDAYICIAHPHQLRSLRDDSAWINASNYGAPTQLFMGEVGRYENVRFIETTQIAYVDPSGDQFVNGVDSTRNVTGPSTVNTYDAIMIGDNCFGYAETVPVEMRDNGVMDFGRRHALAWYSVFGLGMIQEENGCILVTS